jgi:hypothetical protein
MGRIFFLAKQTMLMKEEWPDSLVKVIGMMKITTAQTTWGTTPDSLICTTTISGARDHLALKNIETPEFSRPTGNHSRLHQRTDTMIDVQKLAREAGLVTDYGAREIASGALLERFAALVLEEAALICDSVNNYSNPMTANDCADEIRSLKPKGEA